MSRTVVKKTLHLQDIWMAWSDQFLKKNPDLKGEYKNRVRNYYIWRIGKDSTKIEIHSYPKFRKIMEQIFDRAKTEIIKGNMVSFGAVGKILMKRVERDFRRHNQRRVDWKETNKMKVWDEEQQKFIYTKIFYFTTDDWCRVAWVRNHMLENETVYEFLPAAANSERTSGFRLELSNAMINDPLLKYRYYYQPLFLGTKKKSNDIPDDLNQRSDREGDQEHEDTGLLLPG